jgi:hypothetical protein
MQAILRVISEPAAGTMTVIRQGQLLQVGRTSWADFTIPDDEMGDVHFALEITPDACILRNLSADSPTLLNGDPVDEAGVFDGDQITAGNTVFEIQLQGVPQRKTKEQENGDAAAAPAVTSGYKFVSAALARDVANRCELDDDVRPLIVPTMTSRQFVETLVQQSKFTDGIVFLAAALPKREAVWWGCQTCGGADSSSLPADDRKAIEAARRWVVDPSEENRRGAESAAKAGQLLTASSCVAMAAFLSGGSIGPPEFDPVPPADHLTGYTVACAVKFAAATSSDDAAKKALELGIAVADGKNRWEE